MRDGTRRAGRVCVCACVRVCVCACVHGCVQVRLLEGGRAPVAFSIFWRRSTRGSSTAASLM